MRTVERVGYGGVALVTFVYALQLLVESTGALGPVIEPIIRAVITDPLSALGAGWFSSYVVLNGSTIAAIGLSFRATDIITPLQYFMFFAGSRMGAAFVVVFIGVVEYARGKNESFRDASSVGILSFLTTYIVYVPAIVAGYIIMDRFALSMLEIGQPAILRTSVVSVINGWAVQTLELIGVPAVTFLLAIAALFLSLRIFDRAFANLSVETLRGRWFRFVMHNRWIAFGAGLIATTLTTSVAVSLGLLVPLYNRGYLKREELVPYIMGANITTVIDTIFASAVLNTPHAMKAILLLTATATVFTVIGLLIYRQFFAVLKFVFDAVIVDDRLFPAFIASLLLFPILMIVL